MVNIEFEWHSLVNLHMYHSSINHLFAIYLGSLLHSLTLEFLDAKITNKFTVILVTLII